MSEFSGKREQLIAPEGQEIKKEALDFILEKSQELGPEMEKMYADFHENPELGGEEYQTAQKVKEYLESLGIEIVGEKIGLGGKVKEDGEKRLPGTGVVAIIRGQEGGPTMALRADMDALPIKENKEHLPCSKKDNVMHACGHDLHTIGLMGAAKILKGLVDRGALEGDVVLIFQPSEEKTHQKESGAVQMVKFLEEKGLRERIGIFLGLHVKGDLERGEINVREGVQQPSSGEVDIILKGPGGHVLNIYESPDLQHIFSKINVRLKEVFRPLYERKEGLVASPRTKYSGEGYNVLPEEAKSTFVVRIASPLYREITVDVLDNIKKEVEEIVQEETKTTNLSKGGVSIEIKKRPGYRPVIHRNPELVNIAIKSAEKVIKDCQRNEELVMGGEDFSFYLEKLRGKEIPGVFMMVGAANSEKGIPKVSHHSSNFKADPEVTQDLAALYSAFSLEALKHLKSQTK